MRVYLPVSGSEIKQLANGSRLADLAGFALLPEWAESQEDPDTEYLEEVLLYISASGQSQRIVLVAEVPAEVVDAAAGKIQVSGEFGLKQIQAMFADDSKTQQAIAAGADPGELDMTWFGPTEILNLVEFLELS